MRIAFWIAALAVLGAGAFADHTHPPGPHEHFRRQNARRRRENAGRTLRFRKEDVPTRDLVTVFGDVWSFDCRARPTKLVKEVRWFKNGRPWERVRRSEAYRFRQRKQVLTLLDLNYDDVAKYECRVIPAVGGMLMRRFNILDVVPHVSGARPIISTGQPGNHTVLVGSNLTLKCDVAYIDVVNIIRMNWTRSGRLLQSCALNTQCGNGRYLDFPQELQLTNLQLNESGWYNCTAFNQNGNVTHSGYVRVLQQLPRDVWMRSVVASVAGTIILVLAICAVVITWMAVRYRKEKRQKIKAFENARSVISWTKRVVILAAGETEGGAPEPEEERNNLIASRVVIRRERVDGDYYCGGSNAGSEISEYRFEVDPGWEIDPAHLRLAEVLGEGEFGRVIRADLCAGVGAGTYLKPNGGCLRTHKSQESLFLRKAGPAEEGRRVPVAVKMLKEGHTDADLKDLVTEMIIMKEIGRHENIINLIGTCVNPRGAPLYVLVEYAEHGNLKEYLKRRRPAGYCSDYETPVDYDRPGDAGDPHCGSVLSLRDLLNMGWQVAKGMEYLTLKKCVHRDLAARNVLVCALGIYKISDFGMARGVHDKEYYRKLTYGKVPLKWMAPESVFDRVYSSRSDVWSFGITLWEIFSFGEDPYKNLPPESVLERLREGRILPRPYRCPDPVRRVMEGCWRHEPEDRPRWPEITNSLRSFGSEGYLPMTNRPLPAPAAAAERASSGYDSS